jgi:hypothetical protein
VRQAAQEAATEAAAAAGGRPVHASVVAVPGCIQLLVTLMSLAAGGLGDDEHEEVTTTDGHGNQAMQEGRASPVDSDSGTAERLTSSVSGSSNIIVAAAATTDAAAASGVGGVESPGEGLGYLSHSSSSSSHSSRNSSSTAFDDEQEEGQLDPATFAAILSDKLQQLAAQGQHTDLAQQALQQVQVHLQVNDQHFLLTPTTGAEPGSSSSQGGQREQQVQLTLVNSSTAAGETTGTATMGPAGVLQEGAWVWPLCLPLDERPNPSPPPTAAAAAAASAASGSQKPAAHQQQQQGQSVPQQLLQQEEGQGEPFMEAVTVHGLHVPWVRVVVACDGGIVLVDQVKQVNHGCVR